MVDRFVVEDDGCDRLSIVHDRNLLSIEMGEGDDIKTFTWDCGDTEDWRAFIRFQEALGRLSTAASLTGWEMRHPDGESEDDDA